MSLLWQLLPFALLAAVTVAVAYVYVAQSSSRRIGQRARKSLHGDSVALTPPAAQPISNPTRTIPAAGTTAQIRRLHEFGITAVQIGTVLQVPVEEVDLVIRLSQYETRSEAAAGNSPVPRPISAR